MCAAQAVPLLQTVFRVEADSLHLTLVGRFLYDVMHFVTEVKEIAAGLATPASTAAKEAKLLQCDRTYRPITEVQGFVKHPALLYQKTGIICPQTLQWMSQAELLTNTQRNKFTAENSFTPATRSGLLNACTYFCAVKTAIRRNEAACCPGMLALSICTCVKVTMFGPQKTVRRKHLYADCIHALTLFALNAMRF